MADIRYWVWLSEALPKGSNTVNVLLNHLESPQEVFRLAEKKDEAIKRLVPQKEFVGLAQTSLERAEKILKSCAAKGIRVMSQEDPAFPESLKQIYGTPPGLYIKGNLGDLNADPSIGVVGTRKSSELGRKATGNLCYELSRCGITIVSGCAVGIDEYAHRGALKAGGRTIGVMGCGLDVNYPAKNEELKAAMLRNGALVGELPPGAQVEKTYFPIRNRILAGLSHSVLVTQAPVRSGALITAEHALQQGKDVYCLPPLEYGAPRYNGTVKFLRDGAIPVYDASDILLEYYKWFRHRLDLEKTLSVIKEHRGPMSRGTETGQRKQSTSERAAASADRESRRASPVLPESVSGPAKSLYRVMGQEFLPVEELARQVGLTVGQTLAALTELEIAGVAQMGPGRTCRKV